MKLVFDIETNGLLYDRIWMLVARDITTNQEYIFTDHDDEYPNLIEFKELFNKASALIGHNIINFDLPALKKLTGWTLSNGQKVFDTLLISQLNDFFRPQLDKYKSLSKKGSHAMATWGFFVDDQKHDDPPWDVYSNALLQRCRSDVLINIKIYNHLLKEVKGIKNMSPGYSDAIRLEHEFALEIAEQEANGWKFNITEANKLLRKIMIEMSEIELNIEPKLANKVLYLDKEPREPKILKDGRYDKITRDWFKVTYPGEKSIPDQYQRTREKITDLGSNEAVIDLLLEEGWKPTEYNWKVEIVGGRKIFKQMSPKITEDSLENMDESVSELGHSVGRWRMLRSRKGFIEGQIKNCREDGRSPCGGFTLGTNTSRMRHRGIVNVPGAYAPLGKDVRSLFIAEDGYNVVSADSASNQLRGFCHYLNNDDVSNAVAFGTSEEGTDIHTRNAAIVDVPRNVVKNMTYALLFGAGDKKLAETGGFKKTEGAMVRAKMVKAYPGFDQLVAKVNQEWEKNKNIVGRGFVWAMDGRPIFCEKHKSFNALIQAFEAISMKEAVVESMKRIRAEGLDAKLLCMMHDEINLEVSKKDSERAAEILGYCLSKHITEKYSLNIPMDSDPQIGSSWKEVH